MSLLGGLEKFGFSDDDITELNKKPEKKEEEKKEEVKIIKTEEKDLILDRVIPCPICNQDVPTKTVKQRIKRLEPDFDLRPNYEGVDSIKYGVTLCPHCGYAALNRFFNHVSPGQKKLIRENVQKKFKPITIPQTETYSYEDCIDRYKLSLVSTMAKKGKESEKAYTCLEIAWLEREYMKTFSSSDPNEIQKRAVLNEEYQAFYRKAYDGLMTALSTEMPPICGMEAPTLEFMLANMAVYFRDYDNGSKLVSKLISSSSTNPRLKDKALELKEMIKNESK